MKQKVAGDIDPKFDLDTKFDLDPNFDLDPDWCCRERIYNKNSVFMGFSCLTNWLINTLAKRFLYPNLLNSLSSCLSLGVCLSLCESVRLSIGQCVCLSVCRSTLVLRNQASQSLDMACLVFHCLVHRLCLGRVSQSCCLVLCLSVLSMCLFKPLHYYAMMFTK